MRFFISLILLLSASLLYAESIDDLLASGEYTKAERKISQTLGRDSESTEYLFLQGKTSLSGESSAARLKDYINKSTDDTYIPDWARLLVGKYYLSQGLYVTARKQLGTIPEGSPFQPEAEYLAARCYLLSGEYDDAIMHYGDILAQSRVNPYSKWAMLGTADAYFEQGTYDRAQGIYQELLQDTNNDDIYALALLGMAEIANATGDSRDANRYYDMYHDRYEKPSKLMVKSPKVNRVKQPEAEAKTETPRGGRFYVQVGAYSKKDNALHVADLYKKSGYKVYMETFVENDNEFYRILIGGYNSKQQAEFIQRRLEKAANEKYLLITR